jgi:hypothetical protein
VPVPVLHHDRPPEPGLESELFTWKPASEWDEQWVGLDVPEAQRLGRKFLDAFAGVTNIGLLP